MYKLIIAKDYECRKFIKLIEGSYEEISEVTSKYLDSNEIRKKYKLEYDAFSRTFKENGDIVIIDDNNERCRVLYKDDINAVKKLILNQYFMRYVITRRYITNTSEWDNYTIMGRKTSNYGKHMRKFLKSRKEKGDFYSTIRFIEIAYENYRKENSKYPTLNSIKHEIQENRKKTSLKRLNTIKERKEELELLKEELINENITSSDMYENINELSTDEIFSIYSLDDLINNLNKDECKKLRIGAYKR